MLKLHPQYIKDTNGNNSMVVLPAKEFDAIMEELDEIEDIRLYDEGKNDHEPAISQSEAMEMIAAERKKLGK